jgi:hypothetical protein
MDGYSEQGRGQGERLSKQRGRTEGRGAHLRSSRDSQEGNNGGEWRRVGA